MNGISLVLTSKFSLLNPFSLVNCSLSRAEDLFDVLDEQSESMRTPAAGAGTAAGRGCGRERRFNRLGVMALLIESGETCRRARGVCAEEEIIFDSLNRANYSFENLSHKAPQGSAQRAAPAFIKCQPLFLIPIERN